MGIINALTAFGLVTRAGLAYSIDAIQPTKPASVPKGYLEEIPQLIVGRGARVVTDVTPLAMSQAWTCRACRSRCRRSLRAHPEAEFVSIHEPECAHPCPVSRP